MFYKCYNLTKFSSSMSNLLGASLMFGECSNLTTFTSDLSSLIDGTYMFQNCCLTSYRGDLTSLKAGRWMFSGCNLDEASLRHVVETINDISALDKDNDEDWKFVYPFDNAISIIQKQMRGLIDIGVDTSIPSDVIIECGNTLMDKGWEVYFNDTLYEYTINPYEITEANGYCPDASSWNNNVYKDIIEKGYVVEYVADGAAWGIKGTEN